MPEDDFFKPVVSLEGFSHDFVMGVEVGRLHEQFKQPDSFEQNVHTENVEAIMRIAEQSDRQWRATELSDGWTLLVVADENGAWPDGD